MYKSQCLGMQGLTGTDFETVVYKLFVFAEMSSFQDFMTAIAFVVEQRVPDIFHVYANLMGASGLKHTFHQRDVAQPFQHLIVSDGMFSLSRVGHDGHLHPVARVASNVAHDGAFILFHDAPHQGIVFTLGGLW